MLVTRIEGLLAGSPDRLADAERMALATDHRLEALWCSLDLGRVLASVDAEAAAAAFRRAHRLAEESSAATERALAERGLHALGRRIRRPSAPTGRWGLSEREGEVARLVATGASNPEIAAALFLSRKTVERHVSNVLAKTGARNRAELASLLAQSAPHRPSQ
jgi:DNA-binding NarL/FixJ family response regulator